MFLWEEITQCGGAGEVGKNIRNCLLINVIKKVAHTNDLYYLSMKKKTFEKSSFIYIFLSLSRVEMVSSLFMVYSQNILDSFISQLPLRYLNLTPWLG